MKYYILSIAYLLLCSIVTAEQVQLRIGDYNVSFYTPDRKDVSVYYDPFADYSSDDFGLKIKSFVGLSPTSTSWSLYGDTTDNSIDIYSLSNSITVRNESLPMTTMLYNKNIDNRTGFVGIKLLEGFGPEGERQKIPKFVAWYPIDDLGTTTKEIVMIVSGSECCESTFKKLIETIHVEKVKT